MDTRFLEDLLSLSSVAGNEQNAIDIFAAYLKEYAKIQHDNINNCYAIINPETSNKLMIEAHIDEIGFQVTFIDTEGYVFMRQNGGIDYQCVPGSHVEIMTRNKGIIRGVIGKSPIHIIKPEDRNKPVDNSDLWIDTGLDCSSVMEHISIGDYISFRPNFLKLGEHRISSKGLDDKVGVYIVAEAIKRISEINRLHNIGIYGVANVQEEVGCKGAKVSSSNIKPALAISVDVGISTDVPNISPRKYGKIDLGKGVIITTHTDSTPQFARLAEQIAKSQNIPYQLSAHHISSGGTNALSIQTSNYGVKTLLLSIPNRYMHTQVEMCDKRDIQSAIDLIVAIAVNEEIINLI